MRIPRRLASLALLAAVGACTMDVPPGTPAFQQGYRDGCRSAWADAGVRGYNERTEDDTMKSNTDYQQGWGRGFGECYNTQQRPTRNRDMGSG